MKLCIYPLHLIDRTPTPPPHPSAPFIPIAVLDTSGLKNQKSTRVLHETATLSSELSLATAVLEAVGILPKEGPVAARATSSLIMSRRGRRQVCVRDVC